MNDLLLVFSEHQRAEAAGRSHRRYGHELTMRLVQRNEFAKIDVGDAVAICQHEPFAAKIGSDPCQAAAGLRILPGLDQRHLPARQIQTDERSFDSRFENRM